MNRSMKQLALVRWLALFLFFGFATPVFGQQLYYPGEWGTWEHKPAGELGFDEEKLNDAVEYAKAAENKETKDLAKLIEQGFSREPHFSIIGPPKHAEERTG